MKHSARVHMRKSAANLFEVWYGLAYGQPFLFADSVVEASSLDEFHDQKRMHAARGAEVVYVHNIRVLQRAYSLRFLLEPVHRIVAVEQMRSQHFDGYGTFEQHMIRFYHDGHAALSDKTSHLVVGTQLRLDLSGKKSAVGRAQQCSKREHGAAYGAAIVEHLWNPLVLILNLEMELFHISTV